MPQVTIASNTVGAEIRYSTDNSDVTEQSTLYSGQFSVEAGTTVKAKAFKSGMNPSPQSTLQSLSKLQTPTISLSRSGSTINITIGNTISGASYRYKVGSAPTSASDGTAITSTGSVNNSAAVTIYVAGWYTGQYNPSDSASDSVAQYTPTLQTPTLSLSRNGSTVNGTIGNTVSDATYVYKVGSAPSYETDGTQISGTSFSFTNNNAVTVYVRGFKDGYNPSNSVSKSVSANLPQIVNLSGDSDFSEFISDVGSTTGSFDVSANNNGLFIACISGSKRGCIFRGTSYNNFTLAINVNNISEISSSSFSVYFIHATPNNVYVGINNHIIKLSANGSSVVSVMNLPDTVGIYGTPEAGATDYSNGEFLAIGPVASASGSGSFLLREHNNSWTLTRITQSLTTKPLFYTSSTYGYAELSINTLAFSLTASGSISGTEISGGLVGCIKDVPFTATKYIKGTTAYSIAVNEIRYAAGTTDDYNVYIMRYDGNTSGGSYMAKMNYSYLASSPETDTNLTNLLKESSGDISDIPIFNYKNQLLLIFDKYAEPRLRGVINFDS